MSTFKKGDRVSPRSNSVRMQGGGSVAADPDALYAVLASPAPGQAAPWVQVSLGPDETVFPNHPDKVMNVHENDLVCRAHVYRLLERRSAALVGFISYRMSKAWVEGRGAKAAAEDAVAAKREIGNCPDCLAEFVRLYGTTP